MQIKVSGKLIFSQLLDAQDPVDVEFEGGTLEELLHHLADRYGPKLETALFEGPQRRFKRTNIVLLNGVSHWNLKKRLASDLNEGDEVRLSPIITGG